MVLLSLVPELVLMQLPATVPEQSHYSVELLAVPNRSISCSNFPSPDSNSKKLSEQSVSTAT